MYKSSSSRQKSRKSFTPTIPWNLAQPVKNYPESLHVNASSFWDKWRCWQSGTQYQGKNFSGLLQSGLDAKWWADSMDCYCYLRNVQNCLSDGKTPYEPRFGEPFQGPVIPVVRWLNIILFLPKTSQDSSTSLVRKFYLEYAGDMHRMRWESGKETFWSQTRGAGELGRVKIHARRINAKEVRTRPNGER